MDESIIRILLISIFILTSFLSGMIVLKHSGKTIPDDSKIKALLWNTPVIFHFAIVLALIVRIHQDNIPVNFTIYVLVTPFLIAVATSALQNFMKAR